MAELDSKLQDSLNRIEGYLKASEEVVRGIRTLSKEGLTTNSASITELVNALASFQYLGYQCAGGEYESITGIKFQEPEV